MAAGAVIGALRVVIGADTASLEKGLKGAASDVSSFGATFAKIGLGVAAAAAATVAAVAAVGVGIGIKLHGAIEQMDSMSKMSQKIGVPVEQLTALGLAASLSDVSMETLGKSVAKLSKTMVEAAANPTSAAANAFQALGVSVKNADGTMRGSSEVLADIAGRFEGAKDGATKTALAMAIFGKAGADLIPLLNAGKTGLKDATDEAKAFGLVISTKTAKSAEAFNDNMTRLGMAFQGVMTITAGRLVPSLEDVSTAFIQVIKDSGAVQIAADVLSTTIGVLGAAAIQLGGGLKAAWELGSAGAALVIKTVVAFGNVIVAVASSAVKWVMDLAGSFGSAVKSSTIFNTAANAISATFEMLSRGAAIVGAVFKTVWDAVAGVASAVLSVVSGKFAEAWDALKTGTGDVGQSIRDATEQVGGAWKGMAVAGTVAAATMSSTSAVATGFFNSMTTASTQTTETVNGTGTALKNLPTAVATAKNALDGFIASTQKSIASQQANAMAIGMSAGARERLRVIMEAEAIATAKNIVITDAMRIKLTELANAAQLSAMQLQGAQMTQEMLLPWELYAQKLANIQALYDSGSISLGTYNRAITKTAEDAGASWDIAGASIAGSFEKVADSFGKENKAMATAAKVFGVIQSTISMFTGAAKALELPFPANLAAMAAVLAQGASLVASIKGTNVPKAATGGTFQVPGGIGGGDRVLAPMMLEPGEMVNVTPVKDVGRGGGGGSTVIELRTNGRRIFSLDDIRQVFDEMNAAMRDGYRLNLA